MASMITVRNLPTVIPVKSGITYTASPSNPLLVTPLSSVWVIVRLKIAMPMIMISNNGIRILEHFSIPLSTPRNTITAAASIKINIKISGAVVCVIKPPK